VYISSFIAGSVVQATMRIETNLYRCRQTVSYKLRPRDVDHLAATQFCSSNYKAILTTVQDQNECIFISNLRYHLCVRVTALSSVTSLSSHFCDNICMTLTLTLTSVESVVDYSLQWDINSVLLFPDFCLY
jgi:hypothetical protein